MVLGAKCGQPVNTSSSMLHADAYNDALKFKAQAASLLTATQNLDEGEANDKTISPFDVTHDDRQAYSGVPMANKDSSLFRGSSTSHEPMPMYSSNPNVAESTLLGEFVLQPFTDVYVKGDPSSDLVGYNKGMTFFKLQQDLAEKKIIRLPIWRSNCRQVR